MYFNDLGWWSIIFFNFIGFLIFMIGLKIKKDSFIEFIGGVITLASFIAMFWIFGIISGLILIPIFWLIITPITGILIEIIRKRSKNNQGLG